MKLYFEIVFTFPAVVSSAAWQPVWCWFSMKQENTEKYGIEHASYTCFANLHGNKMLGVRIIAWLEHIQWNFVNMRQCKEAMRKRDKPYWQLTPASLISKFKNRYVSGCTFFRSADYHRPYHLTSFFFFHLFVIYLNTSLRQ